MTQRTKTKDFSKVWTRSFIRPSFNKKKKIKGDPIWIETFMATLIEALS